MDEKILKYSYDALQAMGKITRFVEGKTFEKYNKDDFLCSAVERQFEILGEALNNIKKMDEEIFNSIEGSRGAISFRNILAHGYDTVDNVSVWAIIEKDLSKLIHRIERLME